MKSPPINHEEFMRRAIALAMGGRGLTEPNPSVGCVLVKDDRIIGEGRTQYYGGPHAEPTALANCKEDPRGAMAYVTLEPCCHTNKQTPPCCPKLIGAGIERVVLGAIDPNPHVNGQGIAMLRNSGIEVITGVLEAECNQLIAPFIARTTFGRPYVTMKWAETADRKIAGAGGKRMQITGEPATRVVHELRARCEGILVGINTVEVDDPLLTPRILPPLPPGEGRGEGGSTGCSATSAHGSSTPLSRSTGREGKTAYFRYVLDRRLLISASTRLVQTAREVPAIVACDLDAPRRPELEDLGVTILRARSVENVLHDAAARSVTHLLVEPGPTLAKAFFEANWCDRLWVFRSSKPVNDESAPIAANVPGHFVPSGTVKIGDDVLTEYLNQKSPIFFSLDKSADFVRTMEGEAPAEPPRVGC